MTYLLSVAQVGMQGRLGFPLPTLSRLSGVSIGSGHEYTLLRGQCLWYHDGRHSALDPINGSRKSKAGSLSARHFWGKICPPLTPGVQQQFLTPWYLALPNRHGKDLGEPAA